MGKRSLAVAITQRPDTRLAGTQLIVDSDVSALVYQNTGLLKVEVVGIGTPSHCKQQMRATHLRGSRGAVHMRDNRRSPLRKANTVRVQANGDAFALENLLDGRGHIFVFTLNQAPTHFDDGDFTPKTPVHLSELQTDIAASHNDQVSGKKVDVHHGTVGEVFDLFESCHLRHGCSTTNVDKYPVSREPVRADAHLSRRLEAGMALVDCAVLHFL